MSAMHPRLRIVIAMAREAMNELGPEPIVVDVGCDHGAVARALGAIGTERRSNRLPTRAGVPRVVADGMRPFRRIDLAIIAGMGPAKIEAILAAGPRPRAAIVHSPQHPHELRRRLASDGWQIVDERLAPEGRGFAEIIRIAPGVEPAEGLTLAFGPRLIEGGDPLLAAHVAALRARWSTQAASIPPGLPRHDEASAWIAFLDALARRLEAGA